MFINSVLPPVFLKAIFRQQDNVIFKVFYLLYWGDVQRTTQRNFFQLALENTFSVISIINTKNKNIPRFINVIKYVHKCAIIFQIFLQSNQIIKCLT
jgi:hypothetical protein